MYTFETALGQFYLLSSAELALYCIGTTFLALALVGFFSALEDSLKKRRERYEKMSKKEKAEYLALKMKLLKGY